MNLRERVNIADVHYRFPPFLDAAQARGTQSAINVVNLAIRCCMYRLFMANSRCFAAREGLIIDALAWLMER
jgi:hypothetical protein